MRKCISLLKPDCILHLGDYYDDGDYEDNYYGFPDDSKLYYAMTWNEYGAPIYFGYPTIADNPQTNASEVCWKSIVDGVVNYDFAYYHQNINSSRKPYTQVYD